MMKKRFFYLFLLVVIFLSCSLYQVNAITFVDLEESHWAYQNIMSLVKREVINGYPDGTYQPEKAVSRAEFLKLIMMVLYGSETLGNTGYEAVHWAFPYALEAKTNGYLADESIIKIGNIDHAISRMEMAQILARICRKNSFPHSTSSTLSFSDTSQLSVANKQDIQTVVAAGIINGYPDGTFGPNRTMTRAECATIMIRVMKILEGEG